MVSIIISVGINSFFLASLIFFFISLSHPNKYYLPEPHSTQTQKGVKQCNCSITNKIILVHKLLNYLSFFSHVFEPSKDYPCLDLLLTCQACVNLVQRRLSASRQWLNACCYYPIVHFFTNIHPFLHPTLSKYLIELFHSFVHMLMILSLSLSIK